MSSSSAIDTYKDRFTNLDQNLHSHLDQIISVTHNQFVPEKLIWKSNYFGSKNIGAAHFSGTYQDKPAVLKVQGAKPDISEGWMIKQFAAQNKSKRIRPPHVYKHLSWNDQYHFEALIMEHVHGNKIIPQNSLLTKEQLQKFLSTYLEYRANCRNTPWLKYPNDSHDASKKFYLKTFKQRLQLAKEINAKSPLRLPQDIQQANHTFKVLEEVLGNTKQEFQHGHFSGQDLTQTKQEIVLYSNLFWKWAHSYYDAVFAHHWHRISLTHVPQITKKQFDQQQQLWQEYFFDQLHIPPAQKSYFTAALLERSIAGLLVDAPAYAVPDSPITPYFMQILRAEIDKYTSKLHN